MENQKLFETADLLLAKKREKDELDAKVKALQTEIDELDAELTAGMTEAELDSFKRNNNTFYIKSRLFASPVAERKTEFLEALRKSGNGSLITESVNANTLASFVKEYCETNKCERPEFLPEDLLNIYTKVNVGIRKS